MMETFGKNPTDPEYAASVIKSALGALYVGAYFLPRRSGAP